MSMNTQIPSAMNTQIPSDSSNINESSAPTPTTPVSDSPSSGFGQESSESTDDDDVEKNSDSKPAADDKACMASNGVFGSLEGEPSTVTFLYGIETVSNLSAMNVSDELLPPLEAAFSNLLLDLLFPLKCLSDSDEASSVAIQRKGGRSLFNDKDNANFRTADVTMRQHSRRGQQQAIVGISARPSDEISNDLKCTAPDSGNRSCFVVQGEITIFLEQRRLTNHRHLQQRNSTNEPGNATASDYELKVRNKLKEGMDSGKFDEGGSMNTDGQIKRVYYIEPDTDGSSIRGSDGTPTTLQTDNGVDAVLVGSVVAAAGALLVIFGIFAYRRRRGTAEIDGDSTTLNPDRTSF